MAGKKERKLNIAHLHWGFPPIIGGVETHLNIILPEMVNRGHKVSILTGSVENGKAKYKFGEVNVYRTPLMDLNWLYKRGLQGLNEDILETFNEFLKVSRPDIIHCHNMHYFSKMHAKTIEELAEAKGTPLILTAHNVWDDILFLELTREIKWTHIIAVSHYIKKELIGVGCDDRLISVIHHGIDTKKFRPNINTEMIEKKYPRLKNSRVIFHPARMGLAKGCDTSIKALNFIRNRFPNVILILAGTKNIIDWGATQQKDIAYLVDLINTLGLNKNVLIDMFSLPEMAQIYGVAQVCFYPSSSGEPFGLTMLEALSAAKPMIVTNSGGMPEIIRDGINGYVVPVKDFEALASRAIQLLTNESLRRRLGYTGREMVEAYYTKEIVTKNTLEIYKRALAKD